MRESRLAVVDLVLGVVVDVLGGDAVRGEPRRLLLVEEGLGAALALGIERHRAVVQLSEVRGEVVVFHGGFKSRPAGSR